jgi:uncharacterized cofD-like protein
VSRRAGGASGPSVVAVGGGHGLARSLGAIRRYAGEITGIVSVADDGGSSGRLRDALGIAAPGDLRRCIGALVPVPTPLSRSLEHRFGGGELEGHAFGNLLIAALAATTGDFVSAVEEACRILGTVGSIVPATTGPVVLRAEAAGAELEGQVRIMATAGVSRISLVPPDAVAPAAAVAAIRRADQVVLGPGSLFTSVLAACAPRGITEALAEASGRLVYVCNLREQVPETAGFDVAAHVAALAAHGITPDVVLADTTAIALGDVPGPARVVLVPLGLPATELGHDESLLAEALTALLAPASPG